MGRGKKSGERTLGGQGPTSRAIRACKISKEGLGLRAFKCGGLGIEPASA